MANICVPLLHGKNAPEPVISEYYRDIIFGLSTLMHAQSEKEKWMSKTANRPA
jgi:hypothetical protein